MKTRSNLRLLAFGGIFLTASFAHAADTDGTWNVDAAGNWNDAGNWSSSTIADGTGFTAFFTQELTAARIVTLDTARTIGNITFTDGTTSDSNLTISGANTLTLGVTTGTPVINVTQADRTLTIGSVIAGTKGLTKTGAGTLDITAYTGSGFSGNVAVNQGTLKLSATSGNVGLGTLYTSQINISNGATLEIAAPSAVGGLQIVTNDAIS